MLRKSAIFILLAGLIFTFSITGLLLASENLGGRENVSVRIAYSPLALLLPFFVAVENGYFQEQGLDVALIEFANNDQIMDALITGRVDSGAPTSHVTLGVEQNSPGIFKIYMASLATKEGNNNVDHIIVLKNSSISSLHDLKGKNMGIYPSSASRAWAKLILKNFMDPDKDINLVPMPPTLHLQALESGSVDAVMAIEPIATIGIKSGMAKEIDSSAKAKYIHDPFYGVFWMFPVQLLENNPEKADKIKTALEKSVDYIRENEGDARKMLTKYTPLPEDMIYDVSVPIYHKAEEIDRGAVQKIADILYDEGVLTSRVDTSDIYISEYST
jgi:NitT/TauT family transport system substrate-binding protein